MLEWGEREFLSDLTQQFYGKQIVFGNEKEQHPIS
jgi:hypothetical protein